MNNPAPSLRMPMAWDARFSVIVDLKSRNSFLESFFRTNDVIRKPWSRLRGMIRFMLYGLVKARGESGGGQLC